MRTIDLVGKTFFRLTVISRDTNKSGKRIRWICKCVCGNIKSVMGENLRYNETKSCGCYNSELILTRSTKHGCSGQKRTPEYRAWKGMKERVLRKNYKKRKYWGGRGISISPRWVNSFKNFLEDMGEKPYPKHLYSLDRHPNINGDYEPENCRWATVPQQNRGKRNNRWYEHKGEKMILADWGAKFGTKNLDRYLKIHSFEDAYNYYMNKNAGRKS